MIKRLSSFYRVAGAAVLAFGVGGVAFAGQPEPGVKARYVVLPPTVEAVPAINAAGTKLPTWNGSFSYQNQTWSYTMVGTSPLTTNTTTTIQAVIIPIKLNVHKRNGGTETFDPSHVLPNGKTVTQNTVASPIFDSTTEYTLGVIHVGKTQYEDAFQRANFSEQGQDEHQLSPSFGRADRFGRTDSEPAVD